VPDVPCLFIVEDLLREGPDGGLTSLDAPVDRISVGAAEELISVDELVSVELFWLGVAVVVVVSLDLVAVEVAAGEGLLWLDGAWTTSRRG